ncbi:hypothetical protein [uncultured Winogradskyella sp.]|uniref:hypothetical protein n=1 Tax=uncultured Winogradskyella sp. TaxID=395353 RepID=UPI00262675F2|nr:hypothetical protein [uncultured Winogradskyella sp.]
MRRFIKNSLLFLCLLYVILLALDIYLSKYLKSSHEFSGEIEVWEDIYKSNLDLDVAIYGSSRAFVHFNSQILNDSLRLSTYNFGVDGHNFWLQYYRHKEYLKYNPAPKTIIIAVDMFSLAKREDLYNQHQFLPYMLWNHSLRETLSDYDGYHSAEYYIPFIRYFGKRKKLPLLSAIISNKKQVKPYRNLGYRGMDRKWNKDFENAKKKMKSYEVKQHKPSVNLFEKFIVECKEMNINLVLVYSPQYIEGQNFIKNKEEVVKVFENFSDKYNLEFLNYSNNKISFDKSLFYNSNHLNKTGADIFTSTFANDFKKIISYRFDY